MTRHTTRRCWRDWLIGERRWAVLALLLPTLAYGLVFLLPFDTFNNGRAYAAMRGQPWFLGPQHREYAWGLVALFVFALGVLGYQREGAWRRVGWSALIVWWSFITVAQLVGSPFGVGGYLALTILVQSVRRLLYDGV